MRFKKVFDWFYVFVVLTLFIFHGFLLLGNNALPFVYKSYPTYENNGKENFDLASESLVLSRIDFETLGLIYPGNFHLWRTSVLNSTAGEEELNHSIENETNLKSGHAYRSQVGFQSFLSSYIADKINLPFQDYGVLKLLAVLFFAIPLAIIIVWIKVRLGLIPAIFSLVFSLFSTGFALFSSSLYWASFLFLFPIAMVFLLDMLDEKRVWIYITTIFPLLFLKFLSGYEFMTILGLSMIIPFIYKGLQNKILLWRNVLLVSVIFITAFIFSLLTYEYLYRLEFDSSGMTHLFGRSESWSLNGLSEKGISPLSQLSKIVMLNFIDVNGYGLPLLVAFVILGIGLFILRQHIFKTDLWMLGYIVLASFSWFILQLGHMLFHPRYTTFVLAFPLGIFLLAYLGLFVDRYYKSKNQVNA